MQANEVVETNSKEVHCEGNAAGVGHPRVYLNMGEHDEVICPYCSKKFVYKS
jgi:uncharacterized Zn-finger protein